MPPLKYRDNMTPVELEAFMAEVCKLDTLFEEAHPFNDDGDADDLADHMEELHRAGLDHKGRP